MQVEMAPENPKNFIFTFRNSYTANKVKLWCHIVWHCTVRLSLVLVCESGAHMCCIHVDTSLMDTCNVCNVYMYQSCSQERWNKMAKWVSIRCSPWQMMITKLALELFVFYDSFLQLIAGFRDCAHYCQHLSVVTLRLLALQKTWVSAQWAEIAL